MATTASPSPTLVDVPRREIRTRHMSLRTEDAYVYWVRDFVRFHGRRHPREMGAAEVKAYLTMLANHRRVAASTHNPALSAISVSRRAERRAAVAGLTAAPRRPQRLPVIPVQVRRGRG
ncbi:MAG: site-specific integrase [Pseudomonadota bacterium]